ncbi:hypothetical protein IWQ60_008803, partial [Tieghemiomyces parasiticus]
MARFLRTAVGVLGIATVLTIPTEAAIRRKWRFRESGLYPVTDIGLNGVTGLVSAFGDFNADKNTDLFLLSESQQAIDVYLWNS